MSDIAFQTAGELLRTLRARDLSSIELVDHAIARIERHDPALNAVVARDFERARETARQTDAKRADGDARPLLGLPVTVKDTFETEGLVTTAGSPALAKHVPRQNATAVQRMTDAGAVVLGKTNVPLQGGDCQSYNAVYGTTNNPWDLQRTSGGSSGGPAAALAAGFCALEIGSDIGGSIRNPAHFCGVFGHKPTWGIVSQRGHIPGPPGQMGSPDLNVVGPLARSAEDLSLLFELIVGEDDPGVRGGWRLELEPARTRTLGELRVGTWLDDPFSPIDDEYRGLLEDAVSALQAEGARIHDGARPKVDFADAYRCYALMLHAALASGFPPAVMHRFEEAAGNLAQGDDSQAALQLRGATLPHRAWLGRDEKRHRIRAEWVRFFQDVDVLLMPVHPRAAFPHDHDPNFFARQIQVNGVQRPYLDFLHWVSLATLPGLPATVVPVGRTRDGLPVGVQVVGAPFADRTTLAAAGMIEEVIGGFSPPPDFA
jgi:amidase